jgi:hypothetical protein
MRLLSILSAATALSLLVAPVSAADEGPDLIFKKSTVFK